MLANETYYNRDMSEGQKTESSKKSNVKKEHKDGASKKPRPPRGGGGGRGGGRGGRGGRGGGRSGGRGGRGGRGRGGGSQRGGPSESNKESPSNDDQQQHSPTATESVSSHTNATSTKSGGGKDSKRSRRTSRKKDRTTSTEGEQEGGRGGGRDGRGRGSSRLKKGGRGGRHRSNKNKRNDGDKSPGPPEKSSLPNEEYADDQPLPSSLPQPRLMGPPETLQSIHDTSLLSSMTFLPPTPTLSLPPPPVVTSSTPGVPMILSRHTHPRPSPAPPVVVDYDDDEQHIAEKLAAAALEEDNEEEEKKEFFEEERLRNSAVHLHPTSMQTLPPVAQPQQKSEKKKKKKKKKEAPPPVEEEPPPPSPEVTTTEALKALPAQQVSISASTLVQVRKADSTNSLNKLDTTLNKNDSLSDRKKGKSRKKKGLSGDDAANQKAARHFNRSVRACVERSDPDTMHEILHDKRNHNFALDKQTLETVMKAYIMAAMFDDALYCLRNCALPGTLSTIQTERILTCLPQNLRNSSAYTAADMINALCIATEFDKPTSRTYFLRIVRGIALEFLEEATSARDRICSAPCERLVRSAQCVVDARLKRGKKPTDIVVEPGHQLGVFVPDTLENRGIQAGDAVSILPYAGPYPMSAESLDRNMIEATVTNAQPLVLRLQDKTNANLYAMLTEAVEGNVYRIDKLANRMGFNRQLAAAVAIASPLEEKKDRRDNRRPSPELIKAISAMDENIDRVMRLSGGFHQRPGELTSTAALCAQAVPWNACDDDEESNMDEDAIRASSALALEKFSALEGLNASQRMAVEGAATNRLTLVQGPPGTGKTAVAIRILQHWARLAASEAPKGQAPNPILATSDSNIAVDNLVEGCANVGLKVVRLGRPEAIRPELLRYCIDRPQSSSYGPGGVGGGYGNMSASAFKEKMKILKNAHVICCTCIGSGGDILDNMTFERVLVDEATQATEPAVLVPLTRGCRQLVLVGDHCQLPPTVLSTRAEEEGLGVPLFSRMVACGVPPFMLDTQYRMHPGIAMFPSDLFYGGKLRNGVSPPERRPLAGFPWPREEFPIAFVPVNHGVEMDDGVSKLNEAEAAAACDAVHALLQGGQCTVSDIAVVTPYAAQARLIRRMTRQLTQTQGPPYVEVSSVDGFQGREKEAVVFSAVRSNDYGAVGFVSDWRRVNVSFTRARRALIVIGNDQTLRRGDPDTWMPWLAWADAHGINMDKPGVPRGRYEPEQLRRVRGGTTAAEMLKDVLARQQAQLKVAEKQLEKAEKNAEGHIMGSVDDDEERADESGLVDGINKPNTLEEDLALLSNTDGCWDDSDDEEKYDLQHSVSQPTLTTVSSSNDIRNDVSDDDVPLDAWDL